MALRRSVRHAAQATDADHGRGARLVRAIAGGVLVAGASFASLSGIWANGTIHDMLIHGLPGTTVARLPLADGRLVRVLRKHARASVIERSVDSGAFALSVQSVEGTHLLRGDEATRAAARLMPTVNRFGGSVAQVREAVDLLDEIGDPARVLQTLQKRHGGSRDGNREAKRKRSMWSNERPEERGTLKSLAPRERLALEMALHEESERRAMDGELAQLTAAWREAEEIASIADNLFVLPSVEAQLAELKRGTAPSS